MIFVMAAAVLGSAYVNVLNGYDLAQSANARTEDIAFARAQLLAQPDHDKAEQGGEFDATSSATSATTRKSTRRRWPISSPSRLPARSPTRAPGQNQSPEKFHGFAPNLVRCDNELGRVGRS